jgi:hypothetical protein
MRRRRRPALRRSRSQNSRNINPNAQKFLKRAHQLMENGNHSDASNIFERLARGAEDKGMLRHAPNLYLQAARANLLSGDIKKGADLVNHGLGIFAKTQRWPALARAGNRVVGELNNLGYPEISEEISKWLTATLPESLESYQQLQDKNVKFPLKCPYCGGTLRLDEIERIDNTTGECPYCGSAVRGK